MGEMDPYPRTREDSEVLETKNWSGYYQGYLGTCTNPEYAPPNQYYPYSGSFNTTKTRIMHDIVTPRFKEYQAKGMIVNSPMDRVTTTQSCSVATYIYDSRYKVNTNCGGGVYKKLWRGGLNVGTCPASDYFSAFTNGGYAPTPDLDVSRYIDLAVTQMWANADQSKAAVLASLGEARETVSSITSIIGRLISIIRAIKRLDVKFLLKEIRPKELENRYMELRYALRPLYYDAKQMLDAVVAYNKRVEYSRHTFRGKQEVDEEENVSHTVEFSFGDAVGTRYGRTCLGKTKRSLTVRSGLLCSVAGASALNVWGFDSMAETCWELIPFSFIIDWFFNVGDIIASWTPEAGLAMEASWVTVFDTVLQQSYISDSYIKCAAGVEYVNPRVIIGNASKWTLTETKYRFPDPQRSVLPRFNLNLDTLKLVDLLVIAKNLFFRDRALK